MLNVFSNANTQPTASKQWMVYETSDNNEDG